MPSLVKKHAEYVVGKGENDGDLHFLLFLCGVRGCEVERSWGPKFESQERVSTLGFFIGPYIRREYWCSSQEAESREIRSSISCKNLFLNWCKINV